MDYAILKSYEDVSDYVSQVADIADSNRNAFGFLVATAYEQMAFKGQLWVAVNHLGSLVGYLMFGGTMPILKVTQTYACPSVRGQGVAALLIDALKSHAQRSGYHSISARVASDLPANSFWERVGFSIFRQEQGGKTTNRIINIRGYKLEGNDLFSGLSAETNRIVPIGPVLKQSVYALDLNLLLAVYKAREGYSVVARIIQAGFQGEYSICVTPEFKKELQRQSDSFADDPVMRLAGIFPEVRGDVDVSGISEALREIVFPSRKATRKSAQNDESDLLHLAYCISAGVDGFITREKALLKACNNIKDKYGVLILSPEEMISDDEESLDVEAPLNKDFTLSSTFATEEIKGFLYRYSVPSIILEKLLHDSPIKNPATIYEARLDNDLFGVFFLCKPSKAKGSALAALYLDEGCPKSVAAIDHFVETALRLRCEFTYRLDLYICDGQGLTEQTLIKKGFFRSDDHFVKIITSHFLDEKNWGRFAKDVKQLCGLSMPEKLPAKKALMNTGVCCSDGNGQVETFSWFDFESIIGPRFIVNPDRDCILVSIQEHYANGLIGNVTNQLSLLSSHEQALLLEKAYFRSSNKAAMFKKGGLVAFYVSGDKSIQEIIGFARITYSGVVSLDEAMMRFARQGVLSREELKGFLDRNGNLHVFTFDNFLEFDRRLSFAKAKARGLISDANLVSPERIDLKQLKLLIREVFDE